MKSKEIAFISPTLLTLIAALFVFPAEYPPSELVLRYLAIGSILVCAR